MDLFKYYEPYGAINVCSSQMHFDKPLSSVATSLSSYVRHPDDLHLHGYEGKSLLITSATISLQTQTNTNIIYSTPVPVLSNRL